MLIILSFDVVHFYKQPIQYFRNQHYNMDIWIFENKGDFFINLNMKKAP